LRGLDFLLVAREETRSRWILILSREKKIAGLGFSSRGTRRELIALVSIVALAGPGKVANIANNRGFPGKLRAAASCFQSVVAWS